MTSDRFPRRFGEYLLLELLGAGGAANAYLARHVSSESKFPSPLVIKRLHARLGADAEFLKRFEHEGTIAVAVDSPYVVRVLEVGAVGDEPYIAMEYIAGVPVVDVINALGRAGRVLSVEVIATLFAGGLEGLHALHSAVNVLTREPLGAVHRDISPRNLLITADGNLRLIDLGLGKSNIQEWETQTGLVLGTLGYMSPEQVLRKRVDARSDLYALAVVMYEFLSGRRYIERAEGVLMLERMSSPVFVPVTTHRPDVPAELDRVLSRALAVRPEERFGSAMEMLGALREAVPGASSADRTELVAVMAELTGQVLARAEQVVLSVASTPIESVTVPEAMVSVTTPALASASASASVGGRTIAEVGGEKTVLLARRSTSGVTAAPGVAARTAGAATVAAARRQSSIGGRRVAGRSSRGAWIAAIVVLVAAVAMIAVTLLQQEAIEVPIEREPAVVPRPQARASEAGDERGRIEVPSEDPAKRERGERSFDVAAEREKAAAARERGERSVDVAAEREKAAARERGERSVDVAVEREKAAAEREKRTSPPSRDRRESASSKVNAEQNVDPDARVAEAFAAVMRAAERARREHPKRAKVIDEIVTDALLWKSSSDHEKAERALGQLASRLAALR